MPGFLRLGHRDNCEAAVSAPDQARCHRMNSAPFFPNELLDLGGTSFYRVLVPASFLIFQAPDVCRAAKAIGGAVEMLPPWLKQPGRPFGSSTALVSPTIAVCQLCAAAGSIPIRSRKAKTKSGVRRGRMGCLVGAATGGKKISCRLRGEPLTDNRGAG